MQSPRKVPSRDSITGRRLCSGILTEGNFALGGVTERGAEDDYNAGETCEADESQTDVRAREDGPGFHLFFVTEVSIARQGVGGKGGLPSVLFEIVDCTL